MSGMHERPKHINTVVEKHFIYITHMNVNFVTVQMIYVATAKWARWRSFPSIFSRSSSILHISTVTAVSGFINAVPYMNITPFTSTRFPTVQISSHFEDEQIWLSILAEIAEFIRTCPMVQKA